MTINSRINSIHGREVLDSRGTPTVEVEVVLSGGAKGRAIVPSGASTGTHEAVELRDGDASRFSGKGVLQAVHNVNQVLGPEIIRRGLAADQQQVVDELIISLDGTADKSNLGANAILGISLATAHAAAADHKMPFYRYLGGEQGRELPVPMVNIISGGRHASGGLDFQDFLVIPVGSHTYKESLQDCANVYRAMGRLLEEKSISFSGVADEGGYGLNLPSNETAISLLTEAIEFAGYSPGINQDMAIGLDVAASEFFSDGKYHLKCEGRDLVSAEIIELLVDWHKKYPVLSIEDGLAEDDWAGWKLLTDSLGDNVQLIGDDLFTTKLDRLERGTSDGIANSILVKPNQVGTLTETLKVITWAQQAGFSPVISARSGETEDATIADLAVATNAGQIKIGSLARSERLSKYNQLLRIEEELGCKAIYRGSEVFSRFVSA